MTEMYPTPPNGDAREPSVSPPLASSPARPAGSNPGTPLKLWRSLDELKTGRASKQAAPAIPKPFDAVTRGGFLKLMGASLALAGLTGCAQPSDWKLAPEVRRNPDEPQGESLYYATGFSFAGHAYGTLIRQYAGRPVKVEGNPEHPASLGATDIWGQASILSLYDPERSARVLNQGVLSDWDTFAQELTSQAGFHRTSNGGAGLAILTQTVISPTMGELIRQMLAQFPAAKWHQWQPINRDNVRAGTIAAFGAPQNPIYRFDQANVILSLDANFFEFTPGHLRYNHDWASRRIVGPGKMNQNRMYMAESTPTITGGKADHRIPVKASEVEAIARAVAAKIGVTGVSGSAPASVPAAWLSAVVAELSANKGTSLVVAGEYQPPAVHALAYLMNQALGNIGKTIEFTDPFETASVDHLASLKELVDNMNNGKVDLLLILDGNPVYDAPADFNFASALSKVNANGLSAHLSMYEDETSALTTWHVPMTHDLETWGDSRSFDGTTTIHQPLIAPLFQGHSPLEFLAIVNGLGQTTPHDLVKSYWQREMKNPPNFEALWQKTLNDGFVANSALPAKTVTPRANAVPPPAATPPSGLEVIFRPDPTMYDGRFANNAWLQELPKPMTRMTWDNVLYVSPAMAHQMNLSEGDVVVVGYQGGTVHAPVWVMPGHPDGAVTLHLGYGRAKAGSIGSDRGYNAYLLRTSRTPWFGGGATITKTGQTYTLASTQRFQNMEGRDIVLSTTLQEFQKNQNAIIEQVKLPPGSMYPGYDYKGYRWGMSINLSTCTGCSACVQACQAENNIPVVGKEQTNIGRWMQWLRIDRYYEGDPANPTQYNMPVPCMQCENAPCELVCPVDATTHSDDGLNEMIYNRCIGTRYCSNNCPYKVRRFNFLLYSDWKDDMHRMVYNPDVTVRERGVMEKCTYCVQRIRLAEQRSLAQGRTIQAGEVLTACQAACPTSAIIFGDMNNPKDPIVNLKKDPLNYSLLAELNTRPRTTYLGAVRNPNPDLKGV